MSKHLVLLGGGHANLHVLAALAREPLKDCKITLVSPYRAQIYSGMLPGWIAGHYQLDECQIPLDRLAAAAGPATDASAWVVVTPSATTCLLSTSAPPSAPMRSCANRSMLFRFVRLSFSLNDIRDSCAQGMPVQSR